MRAVWADLLRHTKNKHNKAVQRPSGTALAVRLQAREIWFCNQTQQTEQKKMSKMTSIQHYSLTAANSRWSLDYCVEEASCDATNDPFSWAFRAWSRKPESTVTVHNHLSDRTSQTGTSGLVELARGQKRGTGWASEDTFVGKYHPEITGITHTSPWFMKSWVCSTFDEMFLILSFCIKPGLEKINHLKSTRFVAAALHPQYWLQEKATKPLTQRQINHIQEAIPGL